MPSLQETVEQQAQTIQQLTEIVAKSEMRYRSIERMVRWGGGITLVLALVLIIPMQQTSLATTEASPTSVLPPEIAQMSCGQALQKMDCKHAEQMLGMFYQSIFGHSKGYLELMDQRIDAQIAELEKQKTAAAKAKIEELKKIKEIGPKMTLMDHVANIDYDFDSLSQMSSKMANLAPLIKDIETALKLMPSMEFSARSMAGDMRAFAATGVPVMGRMNNATSWMPMW